MKTFIVDSFTDAAFKGNPAGVCFPEKALEDQQMLLVAMELGLSETAFVQPTKDNGVYTIRYFSPKKEIPLCGHATLASAKVLFGETTLKEILFITVENIRLVVQQDGDAITMTFPVYDTVAAAAPPAMLNALGIAATNNVVYSEKNKIIMIEINDSKQLASLRPDFAALVQSKEGINGVLVTAPSASEDFDYHYRYFWPWAGTDEDPVTGGVQTFLAKYWSIKLNKKIMKAFQSSARTGWMQVQVEDEKVLLTSNAVIMLEGNLTIAL